MCPAPGSALGWRNSIGNGTAGQFACRNPDPTPDAADPYTLGSPPSVRFGAPILPELTEPVKTRSQYAEEAVALAIAAEWDAAVELNRRSIELHGPDEESHNRLGKALTELGRLQEAKDAYEATLAINPMNTIARKNAQKLNTLLQANEGIRGGTMRVDLNLFVEEMGRTLVTTIDCEDREVASRIAPGDVAELKPEEDGIVIETVRGLRVGLVEAKTARRLLKFIAGGNRYQAGVTGVDGTAIRVIIREIYQDPKFAGKPSFPMRRPKREVEFRPYAKEAVLAELPTFGTDDEEVGDDGMEGMTVDEDEEEGVAGFAPEEDFAEDEEDE